MRESLDHIESYIFNSYLEEVERQLEEGVEPRLIVNIPIAVEKDETGRYTKIVAPSFYNITECLNGDFEENVDIQLLTWDEGDEENEK